jgi:NAD-dependent dihydropyrimidine dehydrogenase PreA subunit
LENTEQQYRKSSPFKAIEINGSVCSGCNRCVDVCPMDVLAPSPEKNGLPLVLYPEECWFCGSCVDLCPLKGKQAIRVVIPLPMRVSVLQGK